jgi:hypothetical protein
MNSIADSIIKHCAPSSSGLLEMHLRRMPESYQERFSPADIARHVRLLSKLTSEQTVEVDVRSLGGQSLEVCVVGNDRTGALAAITTAVASSGLDVQDLQLATYLPADGEDGVEAEPTYFVDVIRVGNGRRGVPVTEIGQGLRERLIVAFQRLAEGDLGAAQTAASCHNLTPNDAARRAPRGLPGIKEGQILDGFRLEERLATGGMSEVYLATQLSLQRKVAVKVVIEGASRTGELAARFARETQVLAAFTSPFVVQVLACGSAPLANGSTARWMAMEFMAHGDLAGYLKRHGPPSPELAIHWLDQSLQGLLYAHQHGILHRDLKPQNLLLTSEGDVKLCDFGLLKRVQTDDRHLTEHGSVMGTPQYISPEQAQGDEADERSDIYSLGACFFQLLSGRLPFEEMNTIAMLMRASREQAPKLLQVAPQTPRPLSLIIDRMLSNQRVDRYQNVHVVLEDLRSYLQRALLTASKKGLASITSTGLADALTVGFRSPG